MKKLFFIASLILGISFSGFSQDEIQENQTFAKQLKAIEQTIVKQNSDPKAIELINAEQQAKLAKDAHLKNIKGYGEAATSVEGLNKFRVKAAESDSKYKTLSSEHHAKKDEKREYISSTNPQYKAIYDQLKAEKLANTKGKK